MIGLKDILMSEIEVQVCVCCDVVQIVVGFDGVV